MATLISKDLLEMLVCPESHQSLTIARAELVERINRGIEKGQVNNAGGTKMVKPFDGGLLRADGKVFYPVLDEIPVLLADEAILLEQLDD
jgi:uncharacterized protein YbaR (Trm112 family)